MHTAFFSVPGWRRSALVVALSSVLLSGCDQLGIETSAQREAEGKAIGSACRQSGRALEDCYVIHPNASKSAIFTGWKEMSDYMRENKIEETKPVFPQEPPKPPEPKTKKSAKAAGAASSASAPASAPEAEAEPARKPARKTAEH